METVIACLLGALVCGVFLHVVSGWIVGLMSQRALMLRADLAWASSALGAFWAQRRARVGDHDGVAEQGPTTAGPGERAPAILDPELAAPPSSKVPATVREADPHDVDDHAEMRALMIRRALPETLIGAWLRERRT
jgi:hypothetical protein